jgi:hypothetical protein
MKTHALIVSDRDMKELRQVVDALKQSGFKEQTQVEVLDQILQIAGAVAPGRFPKDVIRMESRFRIRFPAELSILAFPIQLGDAGWPPRGLFQP